MPPSKRNSETATEKPAAEVFTYEQRIGAPADSDSVPGPETAAVMAAIQAGWRPTGAAYVERIDTDDNNRSTLVVWSVPAKRA